MMIPQELEAAWRLNSGEFSYTKFRITNIEYDKPSSIRNTMQTKEI
ncbi:MAG TPA: hypothetical protein VH796_00980 [Nitrososphaeraceae archaeon]|jgi:hypothetical protein